MVATHLLLRIARQPLHKVTATNLGTQVLMLCKTLYSLPPYVQLHTVKQEFQRHQYRNGKVTFRQCTSAPRNYQPSGYQTWTATIVLGLLGMCARVLCMGARVLRIA